MIVFSKLIKIFQKVGKEISGFSILLMMFIIVADVISRNFFDYSIPGTYAFIENILMPLSVFPALAYIYAEEVLPRLGEFIEKRPFWFQKLNNYLLLIIDACVFALLTYFTYVFFLNGFNAGLTIPIAQVFVPIWPVYLIVPIGYFFVLLEIILRIVDSMGKRKNNLQN